MQQNSIIQNCYNEGKITSINNIAGGIAGTAGGKIINCYNIAEVESNVNYAGGILGQSQGQIDIINCYNTGNVTANNWQASGIISYEYANVKVYNCYNIGEISLKGNAPISGACAKGIGGNTITNCYNIGKLSSVLAKYAIGQHEIKNCYYDSNKVGKTEENDSLTDIAQINKEDFVNLLNNYTDETTNEYPAEWRHWELGENGYPTFVKE